MSIQLSADVIKQLRLIKRNNKNLSEKIEKQLALFQENPRYPSLRTHKLSGDQQKAWSISITKSIRMTYTILEDGIFYFFDIGTRDQVYRRS